MTVVKIGVQLSKIVKTGKLVWSVSPYKKERNDSK